MGIVLLVIIIIIILACIGKSDTSQKAYKELESKNKHKIQSKVSKPPSEKNLNNVIKKTKTPQYSIRTSSKSTKTHAKTFLHSEDKKHTITAPKNKIVKLPALKNVLNIPSIPVLKVDNYAHRKAHKLFLEGRLSDNIIDYLSSILWPAEQRSNNNTIGRTELFKKCDSLSWNELSANPDGLDVLTQLVLNGHLSRELESEIRINLNVEPSKPTQFFLDEKILTLKKQIEEQSIKDSKQQEISEILNKYNIQYLYYITHIDNVENILKTGILPHATIENMKIKIEDISDSSVQSRRENQEPINGRKIHEYVPLYINPKNPMLYRRKDQNKDIVILKVNLNILIDSDFLFTDGNAASISTTFYKYLHDLNKLEWEVINAKYWTDFEDGKRKKCAEFLVYPKVSNVHIHSVLCYNSRQVRNIHFSHQDVNAIIDQNMFF